MLIHQALHGYSRGHNLLSTSFQLTSADDEKMKMVSDWSEYTGHNDNSYITAYPLNDNRYYVVAKSWYADDVERPGCVWTHSLIIDLYTIDCKFDFRALVSLFKRPKIGNYTPYSVPINFSESLTNFEDVKYSYDLLTWLYVNLSKGNTNMLYRAENESLYYQHLLLLLLQYLPLGLLKTTAICTGSAQGRKLNAVKFNLQFATSVRQSVSTIIKENKAVIGEALDGIKYICNAMTSIETDTYQAIRLFSDDINDSHIKLNVIGELLQLLDQALAKIDSLPPFSYILSLLNFGFPSSEEGKVVKETFCSQRISNLFSPEYVVLADMATCIPDETLDFDNMKYSQRVMNLRNQSGIDVFIKFLTLLMDSENLNIVGSNQIKQSFKVLNVNDYLYLATNYWSIYMSLLTANPAILKYSFWIDLPEEKFIAVYNVLRQAKEYEFQDWDRLFLIVLYRNHTIDDKLMGQFVAHLPNITTIVMDYLNSSIEYHLNSLLYKYSSNHISEILNWIESQNELNLPAVSYIVDTINPSSKLVKDNSSAIWLPLYSCRSIEHPKYYAFLYLLGRNWNDKNALLFMKRSFFTLHKALSQNLLDDTIWASIEPFTAKLSFFNEWDKCKKLRKGTIKYLKSSGYTKSVLESFTPDRELNKTLQEIWDKV